VPASVFSLVEMHGQSANTSNIRTRALIREAEEYCTKCSGDATSLSILYLLISLPFFYFHSLVKQSSFALVRALSHTHELFRAIVRLIQSHSLRLLSRLQIGCPIHVAAVSPAPMISTMVSNIR